MQISNEEVKHVEISKLQKTVEALNLELDAAKLATINECNRNAVLQNQLQLSVKEKSSLERELVVMDEVRRENAHLKVLLLNSCVQLSLFYFDNAFQLFLPCNLYGKIFYFCV